MPRLLIIYGALALAGFLFALWHPPKLPKYWLLLATAAVPQIGGLFGIWIPGMFLVSVACILIWCGCNWRIAGVPLMSAGVVLNMLPMALHGGAMPVRSDVLARIGLVASPGTLIAASKDVVVETSALWMLGDWLVIQSRVLTLIASPGDVLVLAGIVWWLLLSHRFRKGTFRDDASHRVGTGVPRFTLARAKRAPRADSSGAARGC